MMVYDKILAKKPSDIINLSWKKSKLNIALFRWNYKHPFCAQQARQEVLIQRWVRFLSFDFFFPKSNTFYTLPKIKGVGVRF